MSETPTINLVEDRQSFSGDDATIILRAILAYRDHGDLSHEGAREIIDKVTALLPYEHVPLEDCDTLTMQRGDNYDMVLLHREVNRPHPEVFYLGMLRTHGEKHLCFPADNNPDGQKNVRAATSFLKEGNASRFLYGRWRALQENVK